MDLKPKDITNFTLLQEKYLEFKCAAEAITQGYFQECLALGQEATPNPQEKERLEYCSRVLDDLHIPMGNIIHMLQYTKNKG